MITRFRNRLVFAVAVMGLMAGGSRLTRAAVLYTSAPDYTQYSFQSTSVTADEQECSPFTLDTTASVTQVSWTGDYFDGDAVADSFTLQLYMGTAATGPNPTSTATTTAINLTRTDLGFTDFRGLEAYSYTASLATPFQVTGGAQYYLAILDAPSTWDWQFGAAGTNYFGYGGEPEPWLLSDFPVQDAFQLAGTPVPEPSPLALGAVATFASIFVASRLRRRALNVEPGV